MLTCSVAAFISALVVGIALHYHKIVENEYYGYPQEWFPSVSATIGDRYPERSFFMLFIAITSGTEELGASHRHQGLTCVCRTSICAGRVMVSPHSATERDPAQIRSGNGNLPHVDLRRMDIRDVYRRPRLARHLYDLILGCDAALDVGMLSTKSPQCHGHQIPKVFRIGFLRNTRPSDLLLHSTQSPQGCRR